MTCTKTNETNVRRHMALITDFLVIARIPTPGGDCPCETRTNCSVGASTYAAARPAPINRIAIDRTHNFSTISVTRSALQNWRYRAAEEGGPQHSKSLLIRLVPQHRRVLVPGAE